MFRSTLAVMFAICMATLVANGPSVVIAVPPTTLGDLQIAYNLECNARQQYLAEAQVADREGYHKVASLLRAVARGEEVHAAGHAAAIRELGRTPAANLERPRVRSTRANLSAAIAEETYERDRMYRMFSDQARQDRCAAALGSLSRAREGETTHAALLQEALRNLDRMQLAQAFYVCPGCGSVTTQADTGACTGCGMAAAGFEIVR